MFEEMIRNIQEETLMGLYHVSCLRQPAQRVQVARETGTAGGGDQPSPRKAEKKVGRKISPVLVAAAKNIRIAAASGRGNMEGLDFAKQRLNEMLDVLNKAGESL